MPNKILKKNLSEMPVLTLTLIFMGMFSLTSVFELVLPALGPALTPWGSRFLTVIIAGASAVFIAFFPLRALQDIEVKFRAIYEDSHDAILILNESVLLDYNRQALHMFGISTVEEMIICSPDALSPRSSPMAGLLPPPSGIIYGRRSGTVLFILNGYTSGGMANNFRLRS